MKKYITLLAPFSLPLIAGAQLTDTEGLINRFSEIVALLIGVVAGLALLVFFWGIVKFISAQGNEQAKTDAKKTMGWGLIALFVMVSVWGIIAFVQSDLGLPVTVPGSGSGAPAGDSPFPDGFDVLGDPA